MASPDSLNDLRRRDTLRLWQRFHVRLTALYGGAVFLVLTLLSGFFYLRGTEAELVGLRQRLRLAAVATAAGIPAGEVGLLLLPSERELPEFRVLTARLARIAAAEPEISSLSVLRKSGLGQLVFVADYAAPGTAPAAKAGQVYTEHGLRALEGFRGPVVDDAPHADEWGEQLAGYAPVLDGRGTPVAIVAVEVSARRIQQLRDHLLFLTLGAYAVAALLLALLALVVARAVQEPLARIVDATTAISEGKLDTRSGLLRDDEFGIVGRHFDQMASGLEERDFIKSTFGSYVSPQVVRRVLEQRKGAVTGQRRVVAVLFCDVRGFTTLSERLQPEEVVRVLNGWLDRATAAITAHGGLVDKFIGDAVMADWGALDDVADPAGQALAAALEMQQALARFNAERPDGPQLAVGVGINVGEVIAGSIGSARKLEFTIIGDTVNLASRLEGLCKLYGAHVVAAGAAAKAAQVAPPLRWLDRPIVQGKEEPTDLYEALDPGDPRAARLPLWTAAVEALLAGRFAEARSGFAAASEGLDDAPARFQIARCDELLAHPPGPGWTPATRRAK